MRKKIIGILVVLVIIAAVLYIAPRFLMGGGESAVVETGGDPASDVQLGEVLDQSAPEQAPPVPQPQSEAQPEVQQPPVQQPQIEQPIVQEPSAPKEPFNLKNMIGCTFPGNIWNIPCVTSPNLSQGTGVGGFTNDQPVQGGYQGSPSTNTQTGVCVSAYGTTRRFGQCPLEGDDYWCDHSGKWQPASQSQGCVP